MKNTIHTKLPDKQSASFLEILKNPITPFHQPRLERIDAEDFSSVKKKVALDLEKIGIVTDEAYLDAGILALKQYYAVALLDPNNSHAISDTLDPFWHAHILFSQRYTDFCQDVAGAFMHHFPLDHDNNAQVENVDALYRYTINTLPKLFTVTDSRFWPQQLSRERLICMHKGNQEVYGEDVYLHALLPADPMGMNHVFS
jgi:hypothetical protein